MQYTIFAIFNSRKLTIFNAKIHGKPQPQRKAGKYKKYLKKYQINYDKSIDLLRANLYNNN